MITVHELDDPGAAKPMLRILRNKVDEPTFDRRLARAAAKGYKVIVARKDNQVIGALGYRVVDDLCWGRSLFIDDLVVDPDHRSEGIGAALLKRAKDIAAGTCDHLRLSSGLVRTDAHRFYEAHGIVRSSYQFVAKT
ncbi:MAG: GNAT family N-acetyltransferase [Pseudomonadota bacterium]